MTSPSSATNRRSSSFGAFRPQPMQVRTGRCSRLTQAAPRPFPPASRAAAPPPLGPPRPRPLIGAADRHRLAGLDRLARRLAVGEGGVCRDAAEAGARNRGVRATLSVGEDRGTAAGEVLPLLASTEGGLRLGGRELGLGLDVDLPAGEAGGGAGGSAPPSRRARPPGPRGGDRRPLCLL